MRYLIVLCLASLLPVTASAKSNNSIPGQISNLEDQIGVIEADVASLQAQIAALESKVEAIGDVSTTAVDCSADSAALQTAIDDAPAIGAIFNVSGQCGDIEVTGRTNLALNGSSAGMGELTISASRNIQIGGFTTGIVTASHNSSVFLTDDMNINGDTFVEFNSTLLQQEGTLNVTGLLSGALSAQLLISNGTLSGGWALSRSSSLILRAPDPSKSIVASGSMGAFSGSHFLAQGQSAEGEGSVTLTTDIINANRSSAIFFAGDLVEVNADSIRVFLNAVLDALFQPIAIFNVTEVRLFQGGVARGFFPDAPGPVEVVCDDSATAAFSFACAP